MRYQLNGNQYSDEELSVRMTVPDGWTAELAQTPELRAIDDEKWIEQAIYHPQYGSSLKTIAEEKQAKSACVLVSDATRAVPTSRLIRYVVQELIQAGMEYKNIHAIVGIGVHRPATEDEMRMFLGDLYGRITIENHNPYDSSGLIEIGQTSRNTPVIVNRRAYDCDLHIQIGKIEPHEFAGFSGGRKSVLPGISAEKTIHINHRPEMILHRRAAIGVLDGNPVHEDMTEAAELFRIDFGVNCVLNNRLELSAVFAGTMEKSFLAAVDFVRRNLAVKLHMPDIIVTTPGQPLDIDFYQSVKALIALTEILDQNTKTVFYCGCPEGVNSPDMLRAFQSGEKLEEVVSYTKANYQIQMDHVLLLSKILGKGADIYTSCPNVSNEDLKAMFLIPCDSPQNALLSAVQATGKSHGTILFYPRPQTGLPSKGV